MAINQERIEAVLMLERRIAAGNSVVISPAFLDSILNSVQNGGHICFTGTGGVQGGKSADEPDKT